jgi:hypothetical protein
MDEAAFLRNKAQRALRVAALVCDDKAAANLRKLAHQYLERTRALEAAAHQSSAAEPAQVVEQQPQPQPKKESRRSEQKTRRGVRRGGLAGVEPG